MITAKVTVKTATACHVFSALNRSIEAISEEAEKLVGDEPFGLTILVLQ